MDTERLSSVSLFQGLDGDQLARVAAMCTEEDVEIGRVLTQEADLSSRFYAILDGHVAVTTSGGFIALLGPGEVIGEIGALRKAQRSANVVAITPVSAVSMMAWDLRSLADEMPDLRQGLEQTVAQRLAALDGG